MTVLERFLNYVVVETTSDPYCGKLSKYQKPAGFRTYLNGRNEKIRTYGCRSG